MKYIQLIDIICILSIILSSFLGFDDKYRVLGGPIGSGSFGDVFKVERKNDKHNLIMKKTRQTKKDNETEILKALEHSNIVKYVEVFYEGGFCLIITEFCEGG